MWGSGGTGVSPVQPGGDARLSTSKLDGLQEKPYILPEARRIESFTDTSATKSASTAQIAADSMLP
jgi:hypothetical protein